LCFAEAPPDEEVEVCMLMQECLAMREKYVFREKEHPWEKEEITDPSTPKPNLQPFHYDPEPASMVRDF
jgi:AMP deaminase